MLGAVSLERDGVPVAGRSSQRRRLALLVLLAAARGRPLSRDKLLGYLWPERDMDAARHSLSQSLYAIRQELGEDALVAGVDELRINPDRLASDLADFERAIEDEHLEVAAAAYGGPFLDGFFLSDAPEFERWAEQRRAELSHAHARVLDRLADAAAASGDHAQAAGYLRRRAAGQPLDSAVAIHLMTELAAAGDRAGAIQHARIHSALLKQELDAAPDPAVTELAERIRADLTEFTPVRTPPPAAPPDPAIAVRHAERDAAAPASRPDAGAAASPRPLAKSLAVGAIAAATLIVAASIAVGRGDRADATGAPRGVVFGSVVGPDTALALAVGEALRAELASARELRLVGELPVQETQRLMGVVPGTPLTAEMAVGVAQRHGAAFVVTGSAVVLGSTVHLGAQLLDAATGSPVAMLSERAATVDEVVPAAVRLAGALRRRAAQTPVVGSLSALPAVTTTSLPALRNFALARVALARSDYPGAIALLEAAIEHDSLFALAHLLVGDLLWYVDQQRHAESHLETAQRLAPALPPRERLIVRARYEQLVRDRVDSAIAYWEQLRTIYPDEITAYEGLVWAYSAKGETARIEEITEAALRLGVVTGPLLRARLSALLQLRDSAAALAFTREMAGRWTEGVSQAYWWLALRRRDWTGALRMLDSGIAVAPAPARAAAAPYRQIPLLALGRLDEARREMELAVQGGRVQFPPRALLLQAQGEIGWGVPGRRPAALSRAALRWVRDADISPPAVARLVERAVVVSALAGDAAAVESARRLLLGRDAGRGLPSFAAALATVDASAAFARGDARRAAELAAASWPATFLGRSNATVMMLEAEARAGMQDRAGADSLYRAILDARGFQDADLETLSVLRAIAARRLDRG